MTEGVGRSAWHGIEVRHLAALQALAEEASFHGAARRLGYSQPDMAGHVHDYGTKFLVAAGLLNLLAMVDAWEIATGKKD